MIRRVTASALLLLLLASGCARAERTIWRELGPGLELARFDSRERRVSAAGDLVGLRVDPARRELRVMEPGPLTGAHGLTLAAWAQTFGLVAAINAGMYQEDHRTHVGFCQIDGEISNPSVNDYLSALAYDPVSSEDPPFRLFDLEETPLREVRARYRTVVQNLRLIKRERQNRWQPLGDRWTEAALGEDAAGRALLIHCTTPWSMYEFNELLLALPLDLVAAQHLEGRSQARLWLDDAAGRGDGVSGRQRGTGPVLPNIIGIVGEDDGAGGRE